MSVYVFTGPTISSAEASRELDAVYLPPAAEGDIYRISLRRPKAIGLIDGFFQSTPAVRHKEILWAMSHGIHVFGSASIGALRAAELATFGMEGVGVIFEWYRDGVLEDDDEVAIAHGPSEVGFAPGSEAMVDIRQTLRRAERIGIISRKSGKALEKIGKELFYPDRNYSTMLRHALDNGSSQAELTKLQQWLPNHCVNQKREDALNMLRLMRQRLAEGLKPKTVSYSFENTSMWEFARRQSGKLQFESCGAARAESAEAALDELRLEGQKKYKQHRLLALGRFLALREADRLGTKVADHSPADAKKTFQHEHELSDAAQLEHWIDDNGLTDEEFDALITDEARIKWVNDQAKIRSASCLLDQLRLSGEYPRLLTRAMAKDRVLGSLGLKTASPETAGITDTELLHWYFEELLGENAPHDPDTYSRELGFANPDSFRRALLKEYLYRRFQR
jgi:hypothetical protein